MSTTADLPSDPAKFASEVFPRYAKSTGPDRYARFVNEVLGLRRTYVQDKILAALDEHKQVIVDAANGVGKSYIAAAGGIAALHCNPDCIVNVTAGNSTTLKTNIWKPARSMYRDSILPDVFGGRTLDGSREIRTGLHDEWFFECVSPRYPGDLEGPHNDHVIYIVEEANKPGVTEEHIEAVRSTATDDNDRVLVISNPPKDEANIVCELMESEEWHTLRFSSWDSHNVRVDRDLEDGEKISGLADTSKLVDDWNEYHNEPWPGLERVIEISSPYLAPDGTPVVDPQRAETGPDGDPVENPAFRKDLHKRWYRRRAGVIPPESASVYRPYQADEAKAAYVDPRATNRFPDTATTYPVGTGIDVAGPGSDRTVMVTLFRNGDLAVRYTAADTDYPEQEQELMHDSRLGGDRSHPVAVDATGEGSGLAGYLDDRLPELYRFGSEKNPLTDGTDDDNPYGLVNYANQRTEALAALGKAMPEIRFTDSDLREELVIGSRAIEFETKTIKSRGENGAKVAVANSKDAIKDRLGRSPDFLDAAAQAVWAAWCTPDGISADNAVVF